MLDVSADWVSLPSPKIHNTNSGIMELKLTRNYKKDSYTIGRLYVEGDFFSNTLEDQVRDYSDPNYKVYGKTAIPYGRYRITMVHSPKFSKRYGGR